MLAHVVGQVLQRWLLTCQHAANYKGGCSCELMEIRQYLQRVDKTSSFSNSTVMDANTSVKHEHERKT